MSLCAGAVEGDPFWDGIRDALLGEPSNQTQECHHPKPILFSTGEVCGGGAITLGAQTRGTGQGPDAVDVMREK